MADLSKSDLDEFEKSLMSALMGMTKENSNEIQQTNEEYNKKDILEDPNNFGGVKYNPENKVIIGDSEAPIRSENKVITDEDGVPIISSTGREEYEDEEEYEEGYEYAYSEPVTSGNNSSVQATEVPNASTANTVEPVSTGVNSNIVSRPPRNYKEPVVNKNIIGRVDEVNLSRKGVNITYSPVIVFLREQGRDMGYPIVLSSESKEVNDLGFGSDSNYTTGYVGVLERQSSSKHSMCISLNGKEERPTTGVSYKMIWFPEYKGAKMVSGFAGIRYRVGAAVEVDPSYKGKTQGIDFWDGNKVEKSASNSDDIFEHALEEPQEESIYSQMIQRQAEEIMDLRRQVKDLTRYANMEYNVGMQSEDAFNSSSAYNRYRDNMDNFYDTQEMKQNRSVWDNFFSNNKTPQENIVQPSNVKETYTSDMGGSPLKTDGTTEEYLESFAEFRKRLLEDITFKFGGLESIHTFCVTDEFTLTINNVSYQPRITEEVIMSFPLDVRRACRGGAFGHIFDYSALASMQNLKVVEFPSESFLRSYVAPNLGFRNFRPDYLFDASSSLQEIIYNGFKLSRNERNAYIKQYNMEYGNSASKINNACNEWVFNNLTKGGFSRISNCWSNSNWGFFRKSAYTILNLTGSAVGAGANMAEYVGKTGVREVGKAFRKAFTSTKM